MPFGSELRSYAREQPAAWAKRIERSAHDLLEAAIDVAMIASPEELLGDYHAALKGCLSAGLKTLCAWLRLEPRVPDAVIGELAPGRPWAEALAQAYAALRKLPGGVQRLTGLLRALHADLQDEALQDPPRRKAEGARWAARCAEAEAQLGLGLEALHEHLRRRLQEAGALADYRRSLAEQTQRYFRDPWLTEYLRSGTRWAVECRLERAGLL